MISKHDLRGMYRAAKRRARKLERDIDERYFLNVTPQELEHEEALDDQENKLWNELHR